MSHAGRTEPLETASTGVSMEANNGCVSELTVVLADNESAMRAGVRRALESDDLRVVAEASSAGEAVEAACAHRPALCLIDVDVPGNGIAAAQEIKQRLPSTKIVMLTASKREEDLFAALAAGADGYLLKSTSAQRLPRAVRGVLSGQAALPRELTARLIREFRDRGRRPRSPVSVSGHVVELTGREFEVLEPMRQQATTADIAGQLQISEVTVRRHISAIVHKLGAPDRRSAIELLERAEQEEPEELATA
jgi:two-component system, NarL family, nitrate/nitrite response regulator NarL